MQPEHVGGWTHIEIWVENPEGDAPDHVSNPDHPILRLTDDVADAAFEWAGVHHIDVFISGTLNNDPPEWAASDDEKEPT